MQGFMLDSARTLENRAYYRRFIDFMADRGGDTLLWHFTDDQGCSLRFDSLPEAASPHAYTKDELRELIAYAQRMGVRIIPELATLGHTRYITRARPDLAELSESDETFSSLCPVHPRTREVVGQLLDEVCDLFPDEVVHVGLDEVNFGRHPLTQAALRTKTAGQLFADHVMFLHARLAARGKRLMMWGDRLLKDAELAEAVPRDVLVANWQYTPVVPADTTARLQALGFEVVSCPALISWDQPLFPGESFGLANVRDTARHARAFNTAGVITTVWTPQRYLPEALWPAVHHAAELMREGPDVCLPASMRRFAESFYGMTPSAAWIAALTQLFRDQPPRKPWIAALKCRVDPPATGADPLQGVDLSAEASRWKRVSASLRGGHERVGRERDGHASLILMAEELAHGFDRAARLRCDSLDDALLEESDRLADAVATRWDRDRFADDPRKRRPVTPYDVDEHLLVALEAGTRVCRERIDGRDARLRERALA